MYIKRLLGCKELKNVSQYKGASNIDAHEIAHGTLDIKAYFQVK